VYQIHLKITPELDSASKEQM
jgi:hypothetical protein